MAAGRDQAAVAAMLLIAFGIKAAVFPVFSWLPASYHTAPAPVSALFAGLVEADFEKIHDPINQFVLQPGQALYRAGEPGDRLFTIRSGLVKLVQYLPDGAQRIVRLIKTADVTGDQQRAVRGLHREGSEKTQRPGPEKGPGASANGASSGLHHGPVRSGACSAA